MGAEIPFNGKSIAVLKTPPKTFQDGEGSCVMLSQRQTALLSSRLQKAVPLVVGIRVGWMCWAYRHTLLKNSEAKAHKKEVHPGSLLKTHQVSLCLPSEYLCAIHRSPVRSASQSVGTWPISVLPTEEEISTGHADMGI